MDDLIVLDSLSDEDLPIEENSISSEENQTEIMVFTSDDIDISTPFFQGVGLSGVACMLSLGIAMVISMFRRA